MVLLLVLPCAIPTFGVAMWLGVTGVLAQLSGWRRVARQYPGTARPEGQQLGGQVVSFGGMRDNVTYLVVADAGLYIYPMVLFRFRRPPLLIPWHAIEYVSEQHFAVSRSHKLRLGGAASIAVREQAYQAIRPYLTRAADAGVREDG
jgi:hypothetical protein